MSRYSEKPLSFEGLKTVPIDARGGKVRIEDFARPYTGSGVNAWIDALPKILAADSFRGVIEAVRRALGTDGANVALEGDESGPGSVETGVEVVRRFNDTDRVGGFATPTRIAARAAHSGPYHNRGAAHDAVGRWFREKGRDFLLPFWEVNGEGSDDPVPLRAGVYDLLP